MSTGGRDGVADSGRRIIICKLETRTKFSNDLVHTLFSTPQDKNRSCLHTVAGELTKQRMLSPK